MKVLEARFHPQSKDKTNRVVVALVRCDGERPVIEPLEFPTERIAPFDPNAIRSRLNLLVASAEPRPFEELTSLRSEFWSFVEVESSASTGISTPAGPRSRGGDAR